jgi:hypothetical protein
MEQKPDLGRSDSPRPSERSHSERTSNCNAERWNAKDRQRRDTRRARKHAAACELAPVRRCCALRQLPGGPEEKHRVRCSPTGPRPGSTLDSCEVQAQDQSADVRS